MPVEDYYRSASCAQNSTFTFSLVPWLISFRTLITNYVGVANADTTGATSGAGTVYTSGAHELTAVSVGN
jgi:hypothetical protein